MLLLSLELIVLSMMKYIKDSIITKLVLKQKNCAYIRRKTAFILMFCYRFHEIVYFPCIGETADRNCCSWIISQGSFFVIAVELLTLFS